MQFVAPGQVAEITKQHRILAQETIKRAGEAWQFTGIEARDWGIVKFLADDRRDVIRQMQLSPGVEEGDPSGGGAWRPIRVELKGPIKAGPIDAIERLIDEERRKGANFVCLWIDSPGGSPLESKRLADYLIELPREEVRTVAYIPSEARADAALVALACDQIVMHPRAILGGPGQYQMTHDEIRGNRLIAPRFAGAAARPAPGRCGPPCSIRIWTSTAASGWATWNTSAKKNWPAASPSAGRERPALGERRARDDARTGAFAQRRKGPGVRPGHAGGRELHAVQAELRPGERSRRWSSPAGSITWPTSSAGRKWSRC